MRQHTVKTNVFKYFALNNLHVHFKADNEISTTLLRDEKNQIIRN